MLHPASEREAHAWLSSTSASLELLGLEAGLPLSLHKLYCIGDLLWRQREALETALFPRERSLLDLPDTVVFYDLTNVHYHARPRGDLQHGRSKQKRHDCSLVTLGLTLDAEGFPRRSEILPGDVSEPGTLAEAIRRLERLPLEDGTRPTVVMDAGLSTKQTIAWLPQRGYASHAHDGRRQRGPGQPQRLLARETAPTTARAMVVGAPQGQCSERALEGLGMAPGVPRRLPARTPPPGAALVAAVVVDPSLHGARRELQRPPPHGALESLQIPAVHRARAYEPGDLGFQRGAELLGAGFFLPASRDPSPAACNCAWHSCSLTSTNSPLSLCRRLYSAI